MRITSGSGKIITILDELDKVINTFAVYFREEGDNFRLINIKCIHIISFLS